MTRLTAEAVEPTREMPSIDRRTLLKAAGTGALAALAGCSSSCPDSGDPEPDSLVESDGAARPFEGGTGTTWPTPRADAGNTGHAAEATPPTAPLGVRWRATLPTTEVEGTYDRASAPVVADGRVIVATGDGVSTLRFRDGDEVWRSTATTPNTTESTHRYHDGLVPPVVGEDGTVYVGGREALVALDPDDGSIRWRYGEQRRFGTPVVRDGAVYAGTRDQFVAVDAADGAELWTQPAAGAAGLPAVADGTVVAAGDGVVARSTATGEVEWRTDTRADPRTDSYPVVADGTLYLGGDEGLLGFDLSTGERRWTFERGSGRQFSPPVVTPETLFAVERPAEAGMATFALDRTDDEPEPRWCSDTGEAAITAATRDQAFGLQSGSGGPEENGLPVRMVAFGERFGNAAWGLPSRERLLPPAVVDGAVVAVDRAGTVLALGEV